MYKADFACKCSIKMSENWISTHFWWKWSPSNVGKFREYPFLKLQMEVYPKTKCRFLVRKTKPWRPAARPAPQRPLPSWTSRCPLPSRAKPGFSGGPIDGRENPKRKQRKPCFLRTERFPGEILNNFCSATKKKRGRSSTRFGASPTNIWGVIP